MKCVDCEFFYWDSPRSSIVTGKVSETCYGRCDKRYKTIFACSREMLTVRISTQPAPRWCPLREEKKC